MLGTNDPTFTHLSSMFDCTCFPCFLQDYAQLLNDSGFVDVMGVDKTDQVRVARVALELAIIIL